MKTFIDESAKMKVTAKNRSKRLRKKLRVDEFQEIGFDIAWTFADDITSAAIDQFIDSFFAEVIEPNDLGFGGEGDTLWHGLVCTRDIGKCTEAHRSEVNKWLLANGAVTASVSELYDVWWAV